MIKNYKIEKLSDTEINNYLDSRNLIFNKKKMINQNKIPRLNHYVWWFNNKRTSFVMTIDKKKKIYLWQELIAFKKKKYLIGGWHSNVNKINLFYVLYFLKWQLNYNKLKKITHDWIAVVKRNNKWILKLTTYLGYKMVKENDKEYEVIIKKFNVKFKNFFFLYLKVK